MSAPAAATVPGAPVYQSANSRRRWAEAMIALNLLAAIIYGVWSLWAQCVRGGLLPLPFSQYWTVHETLGYILPLGFLGGQLVAAAFFIYWQRQLLRNLLALGCPELDVPLELATWGWFIPIACWFLPYQSLRQAARFSHRPGDPNVPGLVGLWWAFWLALSLLTRLATVLFLMVETNDDWIRASSLELVSLGCELIAGLLAILVLRTLTEQQDRMVSQRG